MCFVLYYTLCYHEYMRYMTFIRNKTFDVSTTVIFASYFQ